MSAQLSLAALKPQNPCGYLAALGVLRLLSECNELEMVAISWSGETAQGSVVLHLSKSYAIEDLVVWLAARHSDTWLPKCGKDIRKLKPEDWEQAGAAAWFARPDHVDRNGELIPTDWRTYTVKEKVGWLEAIRVVGEQMSKPNKWLEALVGPWLQSDTVSPLGLDPAAYQDGARQASDLSTVKPLGTAGAVWLAANAFPLFPMLPGIMRPLTSGLCGDTFTYPTWSEPLPLSVVRGICRIRWDRADRLRFMPYGIRTMWRSRISLTATKRRQLNPASPM